MKATIFGVRQETCYATACPGDSEELVLEKLRGIGSEKGGITEVGCEDGQPRYGTEVLTRPCQRGYEHILLIGVDRRRVFLQFRDHKLWRVQFWPLQEMAL